MNERLHIVCLPSSDLEFASAAERLASGIPGELSAGEALAWYEAELRRRYPNASVREQDDLARSDDRRRVWYASNRPRQFRIDVSVVVPLPAPDAYHVYVERVVEWQTAVTLHPVPGETGLVGTEYEASYELLARRYTGRFRVVDAAPPRQVTIEAEGSGIHVWYTARFEGVEAGTLVIVKGDYDLPDTFLARIADRLGLERTILRDVERANASYKRLCEREASRSSRRERSDR